jgi:hypothetical protein
VLNTRPTNYRFRLSDISQYDAEGLPWRSLTSACGYDKLSSSCRKYVPHPWVCQKDIYGFNIEVMDYLFQRDLAAFDAISLRRLAVNLFQSFS